MGGGGGNGCDAGQQGFVKGFFWADGTMTTEVKLVKTATAVSSESEDSIPAPATGIVDVVVCEGGNCTTLVLGQGICTRIHETGHHVKAWCETSSHVKVERMVDACDWPTRGTLCHRTKQSQQSAAMRTLWTLKTSTFRRSPGCTQESQDRSSLKAWCEISSHVKVERMDTFVCNGRGELEGKN